LCFPGRESPVPAFQNWKISLPDAPFQFFLTPIWFNTILTIHLFTSS